MISSRLLKTYQGPNPCATDPVIIVELLISEETLSVAALHGSLMCKTSVAWFQFPAATEGAGVQTPEEIADLLVNWTLAALNEIRGDLHIANVITEASQKDIHKADNRTVLQHQRVLVCLGYHLEQLSYNALCLAINLFNRINVLSKEQTDHELEALWQACKRFHPDYQSQIMMNAARSIRVPYLPLLKNGQLWQYGWGKHSEVFFESASIHDSYLGKQLSANKVLTKELFNNLGIPIVRHVMINAPHELPAAAEDIGWPCVVKPSDRGRSAGVTVNIDNLPALVEAFNEARACSKNAIMVETYIPGDIYRLVVLRGKLAFVIRRESPYVIGDGVRSLQALVNAQNQKIAAALRPGSFVGPIPLDEDFHATLQRQQVSPDDIIAPGRKVVLRGVPLLSTGAMYSDVTDVTHPHIKQMAESITLAFGLQICGIDFMSKNISESYTTQGAVIELNTTPGLRVPIMAGLSPNAVGQMILGDTPRRIPVTLIIIHGAWIEGLGADLPLQHDSGWVVGSRSGVGDMPLVSSALDLHAQTLEVLRNKLVAQLTIACDPGALYKHGMPIDYVDHCIVCVTHPDEQPDEVWIDVLKRHSRRFTELAHVVDVIAALSPETSAPAYSPPTVVLPV